MRDRVDERTAWSSGGHTNIKTTVFKYTDIHYKAETLVRPA